MSEHITAAITEISGQIDRLITLKEGLEWFAREFPRTAAEMSLDPARRRTDRAGATRAPGPLDDQARILDAVRAAGGEIKAGLLAKQLQMTRPALKRLVKPLIKAGQLEKRGWRVAVPTPAKEDL